MALVVCLLLGIVLLGVLSLSTTDGQMIARSQSWNGAISMAEAGIEEAFTHLRYCPTNRASNGWQLVNNEYIKGRPLGDSRYDVIISTNWDPIITSQGKIRAPGQTNYIVRTVRVMATNDPMFSAAIEALDGVYFKGSGVTINSYDSRDPNYSGPNGVYDPTKFKDKGKVVCHYGPFDMQNAKIWGHVETGEESALTMNSGGVVGDILWHLNGGQGLEPGWHTSTTSGEISPAEAPSGGIGLPNKVGGSYVFTNANTTYRTDVLQGSVVVKATNVAIIVNNNYGLNDLLIESGASVRLYVNAGDVALKGIVNKNLRAESFMYYGLPGNVSISMQGNASFTGVLYAPNADLGIGGGGNNEIDFLGAIIARIVTVNGKMTFHFDEATTKLGSRGFIACRWDEL